MVFASLGCPQGCGRRGAPCCLTRLRAYARADEGADPHQIVRGVREAEDPGDLRVSAVLQFPQTADRLPPPEAFLDQFAFDLAHVIPRMWRGADIDGTRRSRCMDVLCDMRTAGCFESQRETLALRSRITRQNQCRTSLPHLAFCSSPILFLVLGQEDAKPVCPQVEPSRSVKFWGTEPGEPTAVVVRWRGLGGTVVESVHRGARRVLVGDGRTRRVAHGVSPSVRLHTGIRAEVTPQPQRSGE